MTIDEVIQQPGQMDMVMKDVIMRDLHVAMPGHILTYNKSQQTATIQPAIREWRQSQNPPILQDVPVFMFAGLEIEPKPGDGCLVVFADRCIDNWTGNNLITPISARQHDLSDGFAFVGFKMNVPDTRITGKVPKAKNADHANTASTTGGGGYYSSMSLRSAPTATEESAEESTDTEELESRIEALEAQIEALQKTVNSLTAEGGER